MKPIILALVAFSILFCSVGCGDSAHSLWDIQFSPHMAHHPNLPASSDGSLWYFDFPYAPGEVHYVTVPYSGPAPTQYVRMTFKVLTSGPQSVVYHGNLSPENTCDAPAAVRILLQRRNDDLITNGQRWWSNPIHYVLGSEDNSVVTLTAYVNDLDDWSTVQGELADSSPEAMGWFQQTQADLGRVGMTFGGGCFFGHGVNISGGHARFVLLSYEVK